MYRLILLILVALLLALPTAETGHCADYRKIKIAVMDFQQNGTFDTADVGKIVAEWLTTSLVETGRFDIIERRMLQQIIEEQKMGKSGLVDPGSASKLGRILGVKTIVSGTVQSYGGIFEINARLINVETGSIITAEKITASSTSRLSDLVSRISAKIKHHFPLQGYVVKRNGSRVIIDLGMSSGVRPGMQFTVYTEGTPIRHPKTGEILSVERRTKGMVRILDVKDKTSTCNISKEKGANAIRVGQLITGILAEDEEQSIAVSDPLPPPEEKPVSAEKPQPSRKIVEPTKPERVTAETETTPRHVQLPVAGAYAILSGHTNDVKSIAFSADGSMAASGDGDKTIILWDTAGWRQTATLKGHSGDVQTLQFSPDNRLLASGSRDDSVIIWNVGRQEQMFMFKVKDRVNSVDFNPSGSYLATGANSENIYLWDIRNGTHIRTFTGKSDIYSLDFSPNGRYLVTAGNNKIIDMWDVHSGRRIRGFEGHNRNVRSVAFSPGGKLLFSGGNDKRITIWEVASGKRLRELTGHTDDIIALAVSRNGHRMVSAQSDRSGALLIIWDLNRYREVKRLRTDKRAEAIALSPNGRYLLVGRQEGVLVYRLD